MNTELVYINGSWVPHTGDAEKIAVINPSNEDIIAYVPDCSPADVEFAVAAAHEAQTGWAGMPASDRARLLRKVASKLRENEDTLVEAAVRDIGCNRNVAKAMSVVVPAKTFDNVAEIIESYKWVDEIDGYLIERVPVGVVCAITPWNYPLHQIAAKIAAALGAGNTVVLKPSEVAPTTAWILAEAIDEVGFPAGVFNMVSGRGPTVGEALVTSPDVNMVTFTGSVSVGKRIGELCGAKVRKFALELGGKSACVVTPDADLSSAVREVVTALSSNSGQTCSALTRLLVHSSQLREAEKIAVETSRNLLTGNPVDPEVQIGPLVSKAQQERVLDYIRVGEEEGALRITPKALPGSLTRGFFVPFTVFSNVDNSMRIAQEEIFGPVLCLIPYDTVDQAIALANDSPYGLAAGVWAATREEGIQIARKLEAGQVKVNGGKFNPAAPFGGVKESGVGRELGLAGVEEFLDYRALML